MGDLSGFILTAAEKTDYRYPVILRRNTMFYKSDENGYTEVLTGIAIKTLAYGDKTLFCRIQDERRQLFAFAFSSS